MQCTANFRHFPMKFAVCCIFPNFYENFRNEEFHSRNIAYDWINTFLSRTQEKVFNPSITHHDLPSKSTLTYSYTDTLIA